MASSRNTFVYNQRSAVDRIVILCISAENALLRVFYGRGTCDAKGQIFAMWEACKQLEAKGCTDFGLLLLAGEETGSFGAKAFREQHPGAGDFS